VIPHEIMEIARTVVDDGKERTRTQLKNAIYHIAFSRMAQVAGSTCNDMDEIIAQLVKEGIVIEKDKTSNIHVFVKNSVGVHG